MTDRTAIDSSTAVAAFDLDGTLSEGGSVFKWLCFIAGTRAAYLAGASLALPLLVGAIRSGRWADRAKERLFRKLLAGRDARVVAERSHAFAERHFGAHGRARILARLAWHLERGDDVVVVSASPELYVRVVADRLGATAGLGTRLAVDARGLLTGGYQGRNNRGREKLRRLEEWIGDHHAGDVTLYAYGNSRGDRRMLRAATFPFDVSKLGRWGALRRFPRLPAEDGSSD